MSNSRPIPPVSAEARERAERWLAKLLADGGRNDKPEMAAATPPRVAAAVAKKKLPESA